MQINWFNHYKKKKLVYSRKLFEENLKLDKPYLQLIRKYIKPKSSILECGCGPSRTAISIAFNGFQVTAIDREKQMIKFAKENVAVAGVNIKFEQLDFYKIVERYGENSFDCITHQGVLEHFPENEIKKVLKIQLKVAPRIIFSVPINSNFNKNKYFQDNIYRNLWSKEKWLDDILKGFKIIENKVVRQRSDNLLVVLRR